MDRHPHDPPTAKARRRLGQRFGLMMGRDVDHVRCDYAGERQLILVHGQARDLHGPRGSCTCCPRRAPLLTVDGDPVGKVAP